MTIAITIFIALLVIYLDYRAYRHISANTINKYLKYAFVSIISVSYLLILLTPLLMYFVINEENSDYVMKISMILLTAYLALSVPRLLFYFIWLPVRKKNCVWVASLLPTAVILFFLYSVFVTRTDYKLNSVTLYYDNLPTAFDGYRLAFISDIHIGSMIDAVDELNEIVETINSTGVDAVFFGGDIINVHHSELSEPILKELSRLKARDGVFMVLGNHDTGAYVKNSNLSTREANKAALSGKMSGAGWVLLRDSTVYIHCAADSIAVTGIDYNEELLKYKHSLDAVKGVSFERIYGNVNNSVFNITISHLPQLWHSLCDSGYSDLTLSGHIHAMQFKLGSISPAKLMYKEWSGLYEKEKGKLYINDGIGCVGFLARIGARPEITLIELRKK